MATLTDLALRILISADDRTGPGFKKAAEGIDSISAQLQRVETFAKRVLDIRLFAGWAQDGIRLADAYKTLEARLKLVSDTSEEFLTAQEALFAIAQRTRGDLEATYSVYGKLETVIKQLGGTQQQAIATTETLNQAIALTSQGAAQDAAAILQFSQALGSGVLRGDEFNSVMENSPGLAKALADGLDVPITKLRGMAEAGELTADKLVNALGASAPKVAEQFNQLPLTVGGAMTQLNNAVLLFVGNADKSTGATATLAGGISALADNLKTVADIAVVAAEIYGVKLVLGLSKTTQGFIENIQAARQKAAADQVAKQASLDLLRVEVQKSAVMVKTSQSLIEESRLQLSLASTEEKRVIAINKLNAAMARYHASVSASKAANAGLDSALTTTQAGLSKTEKAFGLLNGAMQVAFSYEIGTQIGEWLNQFESVRLAGTYLAQAMALIGSGVEGMFSGISLTERWEQIKQINAEFDQIRANSTAEAKNQAAQVAAAEQQKSQAIEQAAIAQAASFKQVQEATKALTSQLDTDAKTQTAAINQALTDRLAAIDAMDASEIVKDQQRLQAKINAATQELQLQEAVKNQKLALIDNEYRAELEQASANKDRLKDIEFQKRQAKLSVYQGVAEFYAGEVAKLSGIYANENQLAANARQQLRNLAQNHEQALIDIERLGMTERQKIRSEENEFDEILLKVRAEQQKGESANQDTINKLLDRAKTLHGDLTTAAVQSAETQSEKNSATYQARERLNKLYEFEKGAIEANEQAHVKNAAAAGKALDDTKAKLSEAQAVITEMTTALNQDYALKVGLDQDSLNAAQNIIAELTKPETKVITIVTQNAGQAAQTGGLIHQFSVGGYTQRSGKLPGFGGGDKVKALLEAGEFIIRKEAVKKLGLPFMEAVNQGQMPEKPIKRAEGGLVERFLADRKQKTTDNPDKLKELLQILGILEKDKLALQQEREQLNRSNYIANPEGQRVLFTKLKTKSDDLEAEIKSIMNQIRETGNTVSTLAYFDSGGMATSVGSRFKLDTFLNGQKINLNSASLNRPLAGISNTASNAIGSAAALPGFAAPVPVQPQAAPQVNETINVNLSLNGRSAQGQFNSSPQTRAFLDELKQSGLVSA
ncbi:MAG: tape measure protein [Methylicorpusculum sp.]|uniref:tape measure protein n=1 Tax=Methylicorpusculum sp. TaxID=2713644 RepID=UPI00271FD569|nr:tape measure protein [Methylicorpusculum sp.]MDO8940908.1 tape measure protein [Methylicorpusculum sp.]MDP2202401.1 tape measure protein [Methylicorpusculum sp.]